MSKTRLQFKNTKRWVVKIGSALLSEPKGGLKNDVLKTIAEQVVQLIEAGRQVILVSSGAVAEGMRQLNMKKTRSISTLQIAAAVGQMGVMQAWRTCFSQHGIDTAQVLLTHDDIANRQRYLNARTCLNGMVDMGIIPIINENDTVATDEICFGDNDTLAGLVANMVDADLLVMLTDQKGLYRSDPRISPNAKLISEAQAGDTKLNTYAGPGGKLGRGGMQTKLQAAMIAARSATCTVIASGLEKAVLNKLANGTEIGTFLTLPNTSLKAKKRWLANHTKVKGELVLDQGATKAICEQNKSLLAAGVTAIHGDFQRGELVVCRSHEGVEVAHGLSNYNIADVRRIVGKNSREFEKILGYLHAEELIHRNNLALL